MEALDKGVWGAIALTLVFLDYIPYLLSIKSGKTKPHVYSWILWASVNCLAFLAQIGKGANAGIWATGASGVFGFIIAIVAFKNRTDQTITKSDKVCFLAALLAIPIWLLSKNALVAVSVAALISLFSSWPTFRKSLTNPESEALFPWTLSALWPIVSVFAVSEYTAVTLIYLISQIIANGAIFLVVAWGRLLKSKHTEIATLKQNLIKKDIVV